MNAEDERLAGFVIERMFKGRCFSICDVDNACKIIGKNSSGRAYDKLRTLHCVPWGEIPEDIFQRIPFWLNEVMDSPRLTVVDKTEGNRRDLPDTGAQPIPFFKRLNFRRATTGSKI